MKAALVHFTNQRVDLCFFLSRDLRWETVENTAPEVCYTEWKQTLIKDRNRRTCSMLMPQSPTQGACKSPGLEWPDLITHPLLAYLNCHPLKVVSRYHDPQHQVTVFNLRPNICKSSCLNTHFREATVEIRSLNMLNSKQDDSTNQGPYSRTSYDKS